MRFSKLKIQITQWLIELRLTQHQPGAYIYHSYWLKKWMIHHVVLDTYQTVFKKIFVSYC